jgi:hypothetical protein
VNPESSCAQKVRYQYPVGAPAVWFAASSSVSGSVVVVFAAIRGNSTQVSALICVARGTWRGASERQLVNEPTPEPASR